MEVIWGLIGFASYVVLVTALCLGTQQIVEIVKFLTEYFVSRKRAVVIGSNVVTIMIIVYLMVYYFNYMV